MAALLVLGVVAGVGYYAYVKLAQDASSPDELVARFDEAGVTCERKKTLDLGETRSVWCATSDGKVVNVTTYAAGADYEQWLSTHCSVATGGPVRGAAIVSEDWVIDVQSLVRQPPSARRVADRLSDVLGGEVRTYACRRAG